MDKTTFCHIRTSGRVFRLHVVGLTGEEGYYYDDIGKKI